MIRETRATRLGRGIAGALAMVLATDVGAGQTTSRVNIDSFGGQSNELTFAASLSADGRFIGFSSDADNLVASDTNNLRDVFVHDRVAGTTERVNVGFLGEEANASAGSISLSEDGRYAAFSSSATNLVPNDTNGVHDLFVRDRWTGITSRVSVGSNNEEANAACFGRISGDGNFVVFHSQATNLVPGDTNGKEDVFVRDLQAGVTSLASLTSTGAQSSSHVNSTFISYSGRYVLMECVDCGLVPGDNNGWEDVLMRDRQLEITSVVSVNTSGGPGNEKSFSASISENGRFVAFSSYATNLAMGDTNSISQWNVFIRDLMTSQTELVNLSSSGEQTNNNFSSWSVMPGVSADGRFVAFVDSGSNLVPVDTSGWDVFVRDRLTGTTEKISVSSFGGQGDSGSRPQSLGLSSSGSVVAFSSEASNLVPGDTNQERDIFVHESCVCEVYCQVNANSTGLPARITVQGSASVGTNDLMLSAFPLPDQFGLFYYGPDQIELPFGNGFRCVGGVVYRLQPAVQASGNLLQRVLDLTQMPPGGEILPGSTWNFQGWYRDPAAGGANFNLSDAASITFEP